MAQRKTSTRSRSGSGTATKSHSGAGCLIWFVLLLFTLLLFVLNWDRIRETVSSTGFADAFPVKPDTPVNEPDLIPKDELPEAGSPGDGSAGSAARPQTEPGSQPSNPASDETEHPSASQQPAKEVPEAADRPANKTPADRTPVTPMEQVQATRIASLYFIQVDDDGAISRHEVKRTVSSSDFPLTDALNALLAGPTTEELSRNFITLIPSGTRLLSVQVRGSTAYIDFNEAFMYNSYGIEEIGRASCRERV